MSLFRKLVGIFQAAGVALRKRLLGAEPPVFVEDVFSCFLYTGTGAAQTITNNIDLSTKGGLVWQKNRTQSDQQILSDTVNGVGKFLFGNLTNAQQTEATAITQFNSTGFTFGGLSRINFSGDAFVSWTFRKQPKFFDIVTYTGNGTAGRQIAHNLGSAPGFMVVKSTSQVSTWAVYHRSIDVSQYVLALNTTDAQFGQGYWNYTAPTSSVFTVGSSGDTNQTGQTYVAYLFAHDAGGFGLTGTDNVISCGSFTPSAGGIATVTLGYEPQWILVKATGTTGNWTLIDTMRNYSLGGNPSGTNKYLRANTSGAELEAGTGNPTATGFFIDGVVAASQPHIYIAIRRGPMKVPTVGTSVFYPLARTGNNTLTNLTGFGFPPDIAWTNRRDGAEGFTSDKLRGPTKYLTSQLTAAEATYAAGSGVITFNQDGVTIGVDNSWNAGTPIANWFFKRAPSFMDVVCYTGTGSATTVAHNLAAVPELMIVKSRSTGSTAWYTYVSSEGASRRGFLNYDFAWGGPDNSIWNGTTPTSTVFSLGADSNVNGSGATFVAYLFATCPGVSKVGSYTGTGTTKQIDCGFTGGARFVLIKRTDSTGDWYVWDTVRGIVSGNDPYLLLNSASVEITNTDYIDPYSAGFELSSTAPAAINANGGTYIFLAIA
jgi:hypothetical protein